MAKSQPVHEEELPNFSLGLEFLNPKRERRERKRESRTVNLLFLDSDIPLRGT